jgi:hypothetical protein
MQTFAYCAASFRQSVATAAGVDPLLSPPTVAESFSPLALEGYDLLYFKLHGLPDECYWYGDRWVTALRADQILAANLTGTVVFAANCHLNAHQGPMLHALLDAGARAVIAGSGTNYAMSSRVYAADLLGLWVRRALQLHASPPLALALARARLALIPRQDLATRDAMNFRIFTRR